MNRGLLASVLAVLLSQAGLAWSQGVIQRFELEQFPFGLNTTLDPVFNNEGGKDKTTYSISCYDVNTRALLDCPFSVQITGLVKPETDVANNGGHDPSGHSGTRPLGTLQFGAVQGATVRGRTANAVAEVKTCHARGQRQNSNRSAHRVATKIFLR